MHKFHPQHFHEVAKRFHIKIGRGLELLGVGKLKLRDFFAEIIEQTLIQLIQ